MKLNLLIVDHDPTNERLTMLPDVISLLAAIEGVRKAVLKLVIVNLAIKVRVLHDIIVNKQITKFSEDSKQEHHGGHEVLHLLGSKTKVELLKGLDELVIRERTASYRQARKSENETIYETFKKVVPSTSSSLKAASRLENCAKSFSLTAARIS